MTNSEIQIGPLSYLNHVQSITFQEQKSAESVETTRTGKNLVVSSGKSSNRCEIRFIFTGINEINDGIRRLIALFKCCPIVSVKNEMISRAWKPNSEPYKTNKNNYQEAEEGASGESYNEFVPVALEEIQLSSVPDLPITLQLILVISKVDVSHIFPDGDILYQGGTRNDRSVYPTEAVWLTIWIDKILQQQFIPYLTEDDFYRINFEWYGQDILGAKVDSPYDLKSIHFDQNQKSATIQSEACSIRNIFAYNNIIGKGCPAPQHMGATARFYSVDILFNEQTPEGENLYKEFNIFKDISDEISRSKNRENRILGWNVESPITKLLNIQFPGDQTLNPKGGVFVPSSIIQETTDQPFVKTARVDLIENNANYFSQNEVVLDSGGTDYDSLKTFYDHIIKKEFDFRILRRNNPELISGIAGEANSTPTELSAYTLFWPIVNGEMLFGKTEIFGLLTRDTLKAVFLHPDFDIGDKLTLALSSNRLVSGKVVTGPSQVPASTRIIENSNQVSAAISGPDMDDKDNAQVFNILRDYIRKILSNDSPRLDELTTEDDIFITETAKRMTYGFLGDHTSVLDFSSETGTVIQDLSKSTFKFSKDFTDTLFKVLIERKPAPILAVPLYDAGNIHTSFFKLIVEYSKYSEINPDFQPEDRNDKSLKIEKAKRRSLYPDLFLPTYAELYEDRWQDFAPTYSDFGIINSNVSKINSSSNPQEDIAVTEEDIVSPGCWFFARSFKKGPGGIFYFSDTDSKIASTTGHKLTLSVPFDTAQIKRVEELLKETKEERKKNDKYRNEELTQIISGALKRARDEDENQFFEDMRQLTLAASDKFKQKYLDPDSNSIKIYETNNGSYRVRKSLTAGGLGAELYRVASEYKLLKPSDQLSHLDQDSRWQSADAASEYKFISNVDENADNLVKSMLEQVPDNYENAARLFPACKVYLLDKRGTDLVGDDSFFTINPIVSLDITLDKEDADLAVIRVADPMFLLQKDEFPKGNIISVKGSSGQLANKSVLGSLKGNNLDGYLKRFKISQGRAIQIRMGYDSNPENLKIVFTGRISEIEPGDILTIVAQGWKVELINRQVAFSNTNTNAWGAKDLAVQAIQTAEPEGFGDYYPQRDTNFILRNLSNIDARELASKVLKIQDGSPETHGSYSAITEALNSAVTFFGFQPLRKSNVGLDTRLKNIWYPDIPPQNNFLGVASFFTTTFSYENDSWIIPIQSAWEALKEAARHTWGSIVQVVPYDGEATIFFGDPSQPYYFTKGSSRSRKAWKKYIDNYRNVYDDKYSKLADGFINSREFNNTNSKDNEDLARDILITTSFGGAEISNYDFSDMYYTFENLYDLARDIRLKKTKISAYPNYSMKPSYLAMQAILNFIQSRNEDFTVFSGSQFDPVTRSLERSSLPAEALLTLKREYLHERTTPIIFKLIYGINEFDLPRVWPTAERDLDIIVRPGENTIPELTASSGINEDLARDLELFQEYMVTNAPWSAGTSKRTSKEVFKSRVELLVQKHYSSSPRIIDSVNQFVTISNGIYAAYDAYLLEGRTQNQQELFKFYNSLIEKMKILIKDIRNTDKVGDGLILISKDINKDRLKIKAFVYYFLKYIENSSSAKALTSELKPSAISLPPTMQTFRVIHNIDSNHDIIKNNIVASTRDMWNTVAIEYPSGNSALSQIDTPASLFNKTEFYSGIKWIYFPKKEVTGVIGLQFHPGLSLSNKKLKIFTELNCQSETLAAKLACNRLAEGLRKMYRGTLIIKGKVIKPYDRIILTDDYNNMSGPLEAESVIHHWAPDIGWVSNILPEAVCESNSGAAILQTAAAEAVYGKVFKAIDMVADTLTIASILTSLGTLSAPAAAGGQAAKLGARGLINKIKTSGISAFAKEKLQDFKTLLLDPAVKGSIREILSTTKNPVQIVRLIFKNYLAGPVGSIFKIKGTALIADQIVNESFKLLVCSAFVENSQKAEQIPVILSPLTFNGLPFLAGLETDDPVWAIYTNGFFYSLRDMQNGAEAWLEETFGSNYSNTFVK